MLKSIKNKFAFIVAAILIIVVVATGTVFIFKITATKVTTKVDNKTAVVTKALADDTKSKAQNAINANNNELAKTLLQQEIQQYQQLGDINARVDAEAQLYMINHQVVPPKASTITFSATKGK